MSQNGPSAASWQRTTQAQVEDAKAVQHADRETCCAEATTAGPLMSDELPMIDADPSVRAESLFHQGSIDTILGEDHFERTVIPEFCQ